MQGRAHRVQCLFTESASARAEAPSAVLLMLDLPDQLGDSAESRTMAFGVDRG